MQSSSANDRCQQGSKAQKSEDPFDETLAFFERAAPPSPQAGAPAWIWPGLLRSPLHHQGRRSGSSRSACRSGLLRGRRSRPGQVHAGGPRSEGPWGGERNIQRMPEAISEGVLSGFATKCLRCHRSVRCAATEGKSRASPHRRKSVVSSRTLQPARAGILMNASTSRPSTAFCLNP